MKTICSSRSAIRSLGNPVSPNTRSVVRCTARARGSDDRFSHRWPLFDPVSQLYKQSESDTGNHNPSFPVNTANSEQWTKSLRVASRRAVQTRRLSSAERSKRRAREAPGRRHSRRRRTGRDVIRGDELLITTSISWHTHVRASPVVRPPFIHLGLANVRSRGVCERLGV